MLASATCKSLQCAANHRHVHVQQKVAWCRTKPGGALDSIKTDHYNSLGYKQPLYLYYVHVHVRMLTQSPSVHAWPCYTVGGGGNGGMDILQLSVIQC